MRETKKKKKTGWKGVWKEGGMDRRYSTLLYPTHSAPNEGPVWREIIEKRAENGKEYGIKEE